MGAKLLLALTWSPHRGRHVVVGPRPESGKGGCEPGSLGLAERHRLAAVGVPSDGHDPRLRDHLPRGAENRLAGGQAGGSHPLYLHPDRHPPVLAPDLGAEVDLEPGNDVVRVAAEYLHVERVPALLEVGQEHDVIDMTERVGVSPPDIDRTLEHGDVLLVHGRLEVGPDNAAVHLVNGTGDVRRPLGRQERHQIAQFRWLAKAAHRDRGYAS
jgi:hypothetical protein